jgi:hypothetical protein
MPITPEVLDQILKDYDKPEDLLGENGLLQQLTKALVQRALDGELTHHLGYEKHDPAGYNSGNSRNGTTPKTLKGKRGQIEIDVPRDRNGEFEPGYAGRIRDCASVHFARMKTMRENNDEPFAGGGNRQYILSDGAFPKTLDCFRRPYLNR